MDDKYDICVIGTGPGVYVAAIRAAQLGASVCAVEKAEVGGTCLIRGCIPSKMLISTVEKVKRVREGEALGIHAPDISLDWSALIKKKNETVTQLSSGIEFLFKKNKVTLLRGEAQLCAPGKVLVKSPDGSETDIECKNVIVAAGSEPAIIPAFNIDRNHILTSTEALNLEQLPESMLIVGGGVIGCEFACLFSSMGVKVTILEALSRLFETTNVDSEIARRFQSIFKRRGIDMVFDAKIEEMKWDDGEKRVVAQLDSGDAKDAELALVSIGRSLNTKHIGLEDAGVEIDQRGVVRVDEHTRTSVKGIYAIGDITGKWQLAHYASRQGILAVNHIMGKEDILNEECVPSAIFTDPPIATVGLSESECAEKSIECTVAKAHFRSLGRPITEGEVEGLVKVICEKETGILRGAQILGHEAPEMIHEATVAVQMQLTADQLAQVIHTHPTFSEVMLEAFENVHKLGIHS